MKVQLTKMQCTFAGMYCGYLIFNIDHLQYVGKDGLGSRGFSSIKDGPGSKGFSSIKDNVMRNTQNSALYASHLPHHKCPGR